MDKHMKRSSRAFKASLAASIVMGLFLFGLLSTDSPAFSFQYGLLGFVIGFFMVWLLYLAVWFIKKGFMKTAFPAQSAFIVNVLKNRFNLSMTEDQENMLVEVAGSVMMIAIGLFLAGTACCLLGGLLYITGRLG